MTEEPKPAMIRPPFSELQGIDKHMPDSRARKILVTSALPYANGPLHLGHMLEMVQTDIWVRFQKSRGHDCLYVCADDAHGTAIMLTAEKLGITPEQQIAKIKAEHERDAAGFCIGFDNYYSTHSEENRYWSEEIYRRLQANGHITRRDIVQAFDPEKQLFLADRFIKGTCPRCKTPGQYGDNCEACGATYTPADLIDPVSAISGARPVDKESTHFFFNLPALSDMLAEWIDSGTLQPQIANKLREWTAAGLQEWDISRDAPYFGFEIPGEPGKYFYVWLDAPIGYIASFQNVNGTKMSKSRGTFTNAGTYLDHLDAEYLRYYFAAKLSAAVDDIDLNLTDFVQRVNADVIGKVVNIASRCAGFLRKNFENRTSTDCAEPELLQLFLDEGESIADAYEQREYSKAIRAIVALADRANQYIDERKPWVLAKESGREAEVHAVCSVGINLFRVLMTYLKPVLPAMADKSELFLNCSLDWTALVEGPLLGHQLEPFQPLLTRIDPAQVEALLAASANEAQASQV